MIISLNTMVKCTVFGVLFLLAGMGYAQVGDASASVCLTEDEAALYRLAMAERASKGLPSIPLSADLTRVAQRHVADLVDQGPDRIRGRRCNLHSWSDAGPWEACCYTSDHRKASCMWSKPQELTDYPVAGYEIACANLAWRKPISPAEAIESWRGSTGHYAVLMNSKGWRNPWQAVGVGMQSGYAVLWFGRAEDPKPTPRQCLSGILSPSTP